jgi:hypothetical protein
MSAMNNVSLYIPHVFANISKEEVINVFEGLRIGKVSNIDFVNKMGDHSQYNAVYVHFEYWYDNAAARNFQERVLNPDKEARIVYDDPWYWIVLENKANKHVSGDRKARIDLKFQEEVTGPIVKQLTNADFSNMFKKQQLPIAPAYSDFNKQIAPTYSDFNKQIAADIEADMDQEDAHIINIDGRYVKQIEEENNKLRIEVALKRAFYSGKNVKPALLEESVDV